MSRIPFKCFVFCDRPYFPSGYLQCIDSATESLVQKYSLQIQTLSYSQAIIPLTASQPAPEGCAVAIASDRCTVNLMLKVSLFLYQHQHGLKVFLLGIHYNKVSRLPHRV